jgi:hypothetical protein
VQGNFDQICFNLGGTLARWLDHNAHETYERIVAAERGYRQAHGVGNGLAQPVHHTILPLARHRDKVCQIRWGIASFEHRFGHPPEGLWLPEMAVNHETLEILVAEGLRYTILSDEQVYGDLDASGGPYRVVLPNGAEIAVFVRDRHLSNDLSFGMPDPTYLDRWLGDRMGWRCERGGLHLVATDGETFGHHHRQGVEVLTRILAAGERHGFALTTLGRYLRQHPPQAELGVIENTAWSCSHGLDRWVVGCGCTGGDSRWKGALRRALDNLACDLDATYAREAHQLGFEPWALRDDYIAVVLGQVSGEAFLSGNGLGHLATGRTQRLLQLLEAQLHRQRMYTSCTFFFDDLDRHEPRYAIANGIRALALTRYATGEDLSADFRSDLSVARSARTGLTAADVFDDVVTSAELPHRSGPDRAARPRAAHTRAGSP